MIFIYALLVYLAVGLVVGQLFVLFGMGERRWIFTGEGWPYDVFTVVAYGLPLIIATPLLELTEKFNTHLERRRADKAFSALKDATRKVDKAYDIHTRTAAEMFNVPADTVTPNMRDQAKRANFADPNFGKKRELTFGEKLRRP